MAYRLTSEQRCVLADCTRTALVGWLLTDPACDQIARRWEYKATTVLGFSFSRFTAQAIDHLGEDYQPGCGRYRFGVESYEPGSIVADMRFPLSIAEAAALANDIDMEMATDDQLYAAGLIAAHSPYAQPEVCSRDWRSYVFTLEALGLPIDHNPAGWRHLARSRLAPFRRAVAAARIPVAAE